MKEKKSNNFDQQLRDITLLAINNKRIASDDYLSFVCHTAYQILVENTNLIFYSKTNPIIDKIIINLCEDNLIRRRCGTKESNSFFDQHFYHLTVSGAWNIGNKFRISPEIRNLFKKCLTSSPIHFSMDVDNDPENIKYLDKLYGPFISLDGVSS